MYLSTVWKQKNVGALCGILVIFCFIQPCGSYVSIIVMHLDVFCTVSYWRSRRQFKMLRIYSGDLWKSREVCCQLIVDNFTVITHAQFCTIFEYILFGANLTYLIECFIEEYFWIKYWRQHQCTSLLLELIAIYFIMCFIFYFFGL